MRRLVRRRRGMPSVRRPLPAGVAGAAAVVVVGAGALAGCDSSATPTGSVSATATSSSPSGSPSPSASASPSGSPTVEIPAAAREKTDKGAEAFVRYFVAQSSRAWTTANPELIEDLSDRDCDSCANLASTARKLRQAGHRYADAPITVTSTEALTGDGNKQNVAATIKQHAVNVVDEGGAVVSSDKADNLERTFLLYWKEGRWVVGGIA